MKKSISCFLVATSMTLVACQEDTKDQEVTLDTLEEKVSYAIGTSVAQSVRVDQFAFDTAAFAQAVEDVKAGKESRLSDEEARETMQTFQTMQRELALKERAEQEEKNRAEGEAFLTEKASEEGVVKTESGLMYKILTEGSGAKPAATDSVKAHYRGTLLDGTEFDSSYKRGEPATFGVSNLIKGWVEALQLMPVGSKWELYIPSDLAYGPRGNQGIPPSSTLIFELELLEIVGAKGADDSAEGEAKEAK